VFQRCYACHSVEPGESGLEGPNLHGVVGRPAAAVAGFPYSPALRARGRDGLVWDAAALDAFLADPQGYLPGNSMGFFGLRDPEARAQLIDYLAVQTGAP
jgi:cytochrome c